MPPKPSFLKRRIGWGGRIRTFTILINSEVSYRLDHAPTAFLAPAQAGSVKRSRLRQKQNGEGYF
jgi:hypothetical protein